jgi:hypothetical protein
MFGIELIELISFIKQVGIVLAGAAAMWGFIFWILGKRFGDKESGRAYGIIAKRLLLPLFFGAGIGGVFWFVLSNMLPVFAHEGIVLEPTEAGMYRALGLLSPLFLSWMTLSVVGLLWWFLRRSSFLRILPWFYGLQFIATLILASFPIWTGEWSKEQFFFVGHNMHSIFTFGTVLILDYLFLVSQGSKLLRQFIFPKFFTISKVIWVGLAFDFISVSLVFDSAIQLTPKFFFMQTVIGILIINGVLLAGPIARRMIASIADGAAKLPKRWKVAGDIAGTVSVCSWFSNTFVDFFHGLTLQYYHFIVLYLGLFSFLFVGHMIFEKLFFAKKYEQLANA